MVSMFVRIENIMRRLIYHFRGTILKIYLLLHGCKVGKRLKCKSWPIFRCIPHRNIFIGNDVNIGYCIIFEVEDSGKLILEDHVNLTQGIMISSMSAVWIKKWSAIAEGVSIRDNTHKLMKGINVVQQSSISEPITIGEDVIIGAKSTILYGAKISDGAIVGAHSIVSRKDNIKNNFIYFGCPLQDNGERR